MNATLLLLLTGLLVAISAAPARALDPPHDPPTHSITCASCHTPHKAPGGAITNVAGNANLCQSCHVSGGLATNKPTPEADQALPAPGLPLGVTPTGTSHRWDSGASGHVASDATNTSTGKVQSAGAFTGRYAKTYTVTITTVGDVGVATFSWSDTLGGGATGLTTGTNVPLNEGITVTFTNGSSSPSFVLNDRWRVYVRTDINQPITVALASRISDGKVKCSTCHDQHSQALTPFDPSAPASGAGRHFQRAANDTDQMCKDCHSARNVTLSSQGSHPVGVSIPGTGSYKLPASLPLDKTTSRVQCQTCHKLHYAASAGGTLLRLANVTTLCADCHTLADTITPAAHLNATTGALWPGGQYGSTFPQITDTTKRGFCTNCHQPHGWPDVLNTAQDYSKLLVERIDVSSNTTNPGNVCYTCHDVDGPSTRNVKDVFAKARHHTVKDSEQVAGRPVNCTDCHNVHKAGSTLHAVGTNAVASTSPLNGASGQNFASKATTNWPTPVAGDFTTTAAVTAEYQVCLKCHSSFAFGANPPAGLSPVYSAGTATFTTGSTTVTGSGTAWTAGLVGMWIRRASEPTAYQISAVPSATSITIASAYSGTTASGQAYVISLGTDVAREFNTGNQSYHPVLGALPAADPSTIYGSSQLTQAQLNSGQAAPLQNWTPGQTMYCSDCHGNEAAAPAAQGPHGSAANFILRGPNIYWPTDAVGAKYNLGNNTSGTTFLSGLFCMNCHPMRPTTTTWANNVHNEHSGPQGNFTPDQNACVACHILVPHGGKVSRLIATRTAGLPARYAYQGDTNNVYVTAFVKAASPTAYDPTINCTNACGAGHPATITSPETW